MNINTLRSLLREKYGTKPGHLRDFYTESYNDFELGEYTLRGVLSERKDAYYNVVFAVDLCGKQLGLFRIDGEYSSWDGINFNDVINDLYEVEEKEVVVKEYPRKK
jgi:hypothetical protein